MRCFLSNNDDNDIFSTYLYMYIFRLNPNTTTLDLDFGKIQVEDIPYL